MLQQNLSSDTAALCHAFMCLAARLALLALCWLALNLPSNLPPLAHLACPCLFLSCATGTLANAHNNKPKVQTRSTAQA